MRKNKLAVIVCSFVFMSVFFPVLANAEIGRIMTKKEREKTQPAQYRQSLESNYQLIHESFLQQNYSKVDSLSNDYLKDRPNISHADDVLYLQSLSLLKLGRGEEARKKLSRLESIYPTTDQKASAAASIADSYYYENQPNKAFENYKSTLSKYPKSSQTPYVLGQLVELSVKLYKTEEAEQYKQRLLKDYPGSYQSRDASTSFSAVAGSGQTRNAPGQVGIEESLFYTVQVGSFSKSKNAKVLARSLKQKGYDAYTEEDKKSRMYRVRVGKVATRSQAQTLQSRLKKEGYPTKIYP